VVDGRTVLPIDVQLALDDLGAPEFSMAPVEDERELGLRIETTLAARVVTDLLAERLAVGVSVETVPVGSLPRATFKPRRIAAG
jgi:phenylacetate-CoA ligase